MAHTVLPPGEVRYILRTVGRDLTSRRGKFRYPREGRVVAPDWNPKPVCGGGIHGWLDGCGDGSLGDWSSDALWMVIAVNEWVAIGDDDARYGGRPPKVKAPSGDVVFVGARAEATQYIGDRVTHAPIIGASITGGYRASIIGGYRASITGGYGASITGGYGASITGGDRASITGGDRASITGGDRASITGGYEASITGGDRASITGGDEASITGGYVASITGGDGASITGGDGASITGGGRASITGGDRASITGGCGASITGGENSILVLKWWDSGADRPRLAVAYVGEKGIKPDTPYRLDDQGEFEEIIQ